MSVRPMREVSADGRLRAIATLLPMALLGHTLQLLGEDTPWAPHAWARYWRTPGWHLHLPPWSIVAIAVSLVVATLGLAIRRTRPWLAAVIVTYAAHYLTYPYRIRNHMTLMLASLLALAIAWGIGAATREGGRRLIDLRGRGPAARLVDRYAVRGVAAVLCVTYFYAGLHKTNEAFLAFDDRSAAFRGTQDFWIYGDLGSVAPTWALAVATYGTLAVEYAFPIVALFVPRLTMACVLGLMCFHFPHVAVMNVADYPMLASAFYPALFTAARWRRLEPELFTASRWNVGGAILGVSAQLWWMPWWGELTIFGLGVMAIWGWWGGSMLRLSWRSLQTRRRVAATSASQKSERLTPTPKVPT
ncbi:MAG: hypothetical protein H6722_27170 [Sandaracinus sp.]|nr:hypothetical protein [Sandaracinus sp.]